MIKYRTKHDIREIEEDTITGLLMSFFEDKFSTKTKAEQEFLKHEKKSLYYKIIRALDDLGQVEAEDFESIKQYERKTYPQKDK